MGSFQELRDIFFGFQKLVSYESYQQHLKPHVAEFTSLQLEDWTHEHFNSAISILSQHILAPECVDSILECFPHLATPIVAAALEKDQIDHQSRYVCLGKLFAKQNSVIKSYLRYFEEDKPPWQSQEVLTPSRNSKKRKMSVRKVSDLEVVECCWNLLRADFRTFSTKWCWSSFLDKFAASKDEQVVWVACQCLAKVLAMDETTKKEFMSKLLTSSKIDEYQLLYEKSLGGLNRSSFKTRDNSTTIEGGSRVPLPSTKMYADFGGVLLPIFNKDQVEDGKLVLVNSTVSNLRRIAIGVSTNKAVGLMGPVGCGKSALVEHLANSTGRRTDSELLNVQLGEETDSKLLLGTYKCTDVPGEFIWEPGILTKAVMGGHWLLIEDIESAASDVAAVLANLLEHNTINVPGYRDNVSAAPGFHLFMTHRLLAGGLGFHRKQTTATELLEKHWLQVNVEPLSTEELIHIIQVKFPLLKTIASRMVSVYMLFAAGEHEGESNRAPRQAGQRLISTRDLLKWCTRAERGFEVTSPESALKVLQDAIDIFCCSYSDLAFRSKIAGDMAACLGIIKTKAEYFCNLYKPSITIDSKSCTAGRATLLRVESGKPVTLDELSSNLRFALTRESSCLLERLGVCLSLNEPVLIVGETGTGKTTTIQLLAKHTSHKLIVINMNQQSDSSDLLGGYKPVDLKQTIVPIREEFEYLFRSLFNVQANQKFLENISVCVSKRMWTTLLKLMAQSQTAAIKRLSGSGSSSRAEVAQWRELGDKINRLQAQLRVNQSAMAFSFIEGSLVRALKEGHWVLLDEINLACAETLQCLSGLLEGATGSVSLLERGDAVKVPRHPNFRLLAAMNPATDFGKKDLPPGVRNRFTELFVSEHSDKNDLSLVVKCYLPDLPPHKVDAVVKFYILVKRKAADVLVDSTGHRPLYSLRTLCRGLLVAAENKCGNMNRSLYEALCLSFLTQLNSTSHALVKDMIAAFVLDADTRKSVLSQPIPEPSKGSYVCFEGYWVEQGHAGTSIDEKYLLTPSVRKNLCDIARCVSMSNHPILIQGETSVGKTSLITYLARAAGHKCYRINNHQHTDLQEYVGTYCADPATGSLVFREGVLVEAMRNGHWIILDELNLAPSEVLEALNRVLDDNRELFITETQVTVKAHPSFRLFATQNPPGLYGGRKMLSRAFRNRFVELHFDEIPPPELENILQHRCNMPLSYCKKLVAVMLDLQVRRRGSATFAGKLGFITLRDLFRWGERYRLAQSSDPGKYYDWDQHIADEGYLVLAGRVRKSEECEIIRSVLEKRIKRTVDVEKLFALSSDTSVVTKHILEKIVGPSLPDEFRHIVWTQNLRKTAVLVGKAIEFCEPLLLVGETGCGKTTICQLIADLQQQVLYSVNCHQHSESSDFLGGLRPVRDKVDEKGKLFEWVDGPLIMAVKDGMMFLADEISLADDSVLERLNSLLEPERRLMVSEKGSDENVDLTAAPEFRFVGTMNPGGDYGKKELSPALRNRLTEVWCEGPTTDEDLSAIVEHNVRPGLSLGNQQDGSSGIGRALIQFLNWFKITEVGKRIGVSVRDVLTWVRFINLVASNLEGHGAIDVATAYVHGACLTLLDGVGTATTATDNVDALKSFRSSCIEFLLKQVDTALGCDHSPALEVLKKPESLNLEVVSTPEKFGLHPFYINKVSGAEFGDLSFTFEAPTTCLNTLRLIRSLQIPSRAILLEGSPGVGKTSIVTALAKATGHQVTRINLSEQTDISDLFGADLPVEGAKGGTFAWRDGPFLKALKQGQWILLDELNLASQSVVEGLNSVLDHRGEIFVPELGRTFHIKADSTRLFACQNPQRQGGARKGLPLSFLNRFTQVFMEPLTKDDLFVIVRGTHPEVDSDLVKKMVELTAQLNEKTKTGSWGSSGGPYEWNLRDLNFWIQSFTALDGHQNPGAFVKTIYADRLRKSSERQDVLDMYEIIFGPEYPLVKNNPPVVLNNQNLLIGEVSLPRTSSNGGKDSAVDASNSLLVLRHQISTLRSLALCVRMGWLSILVGDSYCGKTSVLNTLAHLAGKKICSIPVSSAMDTTELLGGFEQTDYGRHLDSLYQKVQVIVTRVARFHSLNSNFDEAHRLLQVWRESNLTANQNCEEVFTLDKALLIMKKRIDNLRRVLNLLGKMEHRCNGRSVGRIVKALDELSENVEKQSSLTAGNFEWVDSILVKCLEEGNWLVVDNVNLCSGAVLDRLNGLLEPDGVLVLGERGIQPDGAEIVIKPHKDFRIFFTLDPARGNISRAMRNRGIEIYVERLPLITDVSLPQVDHSRFSSRLDLLSLLRHMGFTSSAQAQALLHIHTQLTQQCAGYESPHLGHLIDAAFLALQNWKRGQYLVSVTENAFSDVYIKSRTISIEQRLKLTSVLSDAINFVRSDLTSDSVNFMDCFGDTIMLQTLKLDENSVFECLKHQGGLIHAVINLFKMVTLTDTLSKNLSSYTLSDFETLNDTNSGSDHRILDTLPFVVIAFYTFASSNDVDLRHAWIQNLADSSPKTGITQLIYDKILLISDVVRCVLKTGLPPSSLPWDPRHLSQIPAGDYSLQNRLHALICYKVVQACDTDDSTLSDRKINWKSITIIQYSKALKKGLISDLPTNLVIVCEISRLFEILEKIIVHVFNSPKTHFSLDRCWDWLHKVAWKFRLLNMTKRRLFSIPPAQSSTLPPVNFESLNYLTQHYKWFRKHTLPMLLELATYDDTVANEVDSLMTLIDLIDNSIDLGKIHLIPLCRQVMKSMEQPSPMKTTEQCDLSRKIHQLEDSLKIWKLDLFGLDASSSDCGFLASTKGQECRKQMIICCEKIFGNCDIIQGGVTAGELESTFETARHEIIGERERSVIRMWPIYELVALRLNSALRSTLSQSWVPNSEESLAGTEYAASLRQSLVDWFKATGCIAPTSVGVIKSGLELSNDSSQNLSSIMLHLTAHMHSSFAIHGPLLFLEWEQNAVVEDDDLNSTKKNDVYPQDPMLAIFLGCIVTKLKKTSSSGSSLALKSHKNTMAMVQNLKTMLWRNVPVLFSNSLKSSKNEEVFLKNSYSKLLQILSSCLKAEETSVDAICNGLVALNFDSGKTKGHKCDSFVIPVVDTLKSLEQALSDWQTLNIDTPEWWICVGKCWSLIGYIHLTFFSNLELIDPVHKEAMKRQYRLEELKELKVLLCVQELTRAVVGATGTWPLKEQYESKIVELEAKKECQEGIAVRPYPSRYNKITMELKSFMESLFAREKFQDVTSRLDVGYEDPEAALRTRTEVSSWLMSVKSFHYRLKSQYYASYPDVVTPALLALSQVIWGIDTALSNIDKSIEKRQLRGDIPIQQILSLLLSITDISLSTSLIDVCCSSTILNLLKKSDDGSVAKKTRSHDEKIRLSKICMRLVKSLKDTYREESLHNYVFRVLEYIVDSWEKLQEENKIKIAQEHSIYINK
ncbi:hypothetical protein GE061_012182 [Apolygus lucorum]|uniref:Midasin n=1 Tax=Apolygus lucorum TaxID=248454 RepID=A0A8S9XSX5_APOLU|nr:hypothetical protein GE061_012182 [Apolygus lucorum]